jgi:hypothetical protein
MWVNEAKPAEELVADVDQILYLNEWWYVVLVWIGEDGRAHFRLGDPAGSELDCNPKRNLNYRYWTE